jgi:hypothetical protein
MTDLVASRRRAPVRIADALMVQGRSAAARACPRGRAWRAPTPAEGPGAGERP